MAGQINGIVLFVSTASSACVDVMKYVMNTQLNVNVVRLDTQEDRRRALTGKYVKVESVPTMIVVYRDDTIQSFTGADKILRWMDHIVNSFKSSSSSSPSPQQSHPPQAPQQPRSSKSKKKTSRKSKKKRVARRVEESEEENEGADIDFGEMDNNEEEEDLYAQQQSRRTQKRRPERQYQEEDHPPEYAAAQEKLRGLMVSNEKKNQKTTMSSVAEMARKMQEDRKATLGYGDDQHSPY
jgi:hypothetical protein